MKRIMIAFLITSIILVNCNENDKNYNIPNELIGKWERSTNYSSTEAFEITNEKGNYFLNAYTYFKKPTKYVKSNGDTTIMAAGSTINNKKSSFFYDGEAKAYQWGNEGLFIDIRIIDNDHLELKFPTKAQLYNRVK